jgi:hypothetical protein
MSSFITMRGRKFSAASTPTKTDAVKVTAMTPGKTPNKLSVAPVAKANPSAFKKGGKVKKSGMAMVHKGETVMTPKQMRKAMLVKARIQAKKK